MSGGQEVPETVAMREAERGKQRVSETASVSPAPPAPQRTRASALKWMAVALIVMVGGIGGYLAYDHWQADGAKQSEQQRRALVAKSEAERKRREEARRRAGGRIEVILRSINPKAR